VTFFTRLRTALSLANEVEQLKASLEEQEKRINALEFEWGDTLDKLLAREERMRKRYKAEVNRALEPGPAVEAGGNDKGALRARAFAIRAARQ
jgi:hypothetical protein